MFKNANQNRNLKGTLSFSAFKNRDKAFLPRISIDTGGFDELYKPAPFCSLAITSDVDLILSGKFPSNDPFVEKKDKWVSYSGCLDFMTDEEIDEYLYSTHFNEA